MWNDAQEAKVYPKLMLNGFANLLVKDMTLMHEMVQALLSTVAKPALTGIDPTCSCKSVSGEGTPNHNRVESHLSRNFMVGFFGLLSQKECGRSMIKQPLRFN